MLSTQDDTLSERLLHALSGDGRPHSERERLVTLMTLLAKLPPPPSHSDLFPDYERLHDRFLASVEDDDGEVLEERFLELYCHLHMHEAPYTSEERRVVDATGGYWCHAGGLSPILKAGDWIQEGTVSADYGAGNGIQCLLLQTLYPHALSVQIEISARMAEIGRTLQAWLGIAPHRVRWVVDDVCNVSARGFSFVYLYRPVRPEGKGLLFYRGFASDLESSLHPVVVFSIADCLRPFLSSRFERFYHDGHLACYRGPA